jgi:hypothetical protein
VEVADATKEAGAILYVEQQRSSWNCHRHHRKSNDVPLPRELQNMFIDDRKNTSPSSGRKQRGRIRQPPTPPTMMTSHRQIQQLPAHPTTHRFLDLMDIRIQ